MDEYGAFDISVVSDLPLFIDPFLLFNSKTGSPVALLDSIESARLAPEWKDGRAKGFGTRTDARGYGAGRT